MSLAASQRRDQRRRLVLSWNRSADPSASADTASASAPRRPADYAPEALPERQPSLATLIPTSLGGFMLVAAGLLALLAAAVGPNLWEAFSGTPIFRLDAARFRGTLAVIRRCLDLHSLLSLGGWLAQGCLVAATATALSVRLMRRHRRDDYQGRFRAWGWLAGLFTLTAFAGQVPLGTLFATFVSEATGIRLGPDGMGWWVAMSGLLFSSVALWAILPLHERAATAIWLTLCLGAWAGAAAAGWIAAGESSPARELHEAVGNACWIGGGVLAAIAMLAAARSVLREVRGLSSPAATSRRSAAAESPRTAVPTATAADSGDGQPRGPAGDAGEDERRDQPVFIDADEGSDADDDAGQSGRHLSKAERKRLKKLARMGRAA